MLVDAKGSAQMIITGIILKIMFSLLDITTKVKVIQI